MASYGGKENERTKFRTDRLRKLHINSYNADHSFADINDLDSEHKRSRRAITFDKLKSTYPNIFNNKGNLTRGDKEFLKKVGTVMMSEIHARNAELAEMAGVLLKSMSVGLNKYLVYMIHAIQNEDTSSVVADFISENDLNIMNNHLTREMNHMHALEKKRQDSWIKSTGVGHGLALGGDPSVTIPHVKSLVCMAVFAVCESNSKLSALGYDILYAYSDVYVKLYPDNETKQSTLEAKRKLYNKEYEGKKKEKRVNKRSRESNPYTPKFTPSNTAAAPAANG
jgi:hypothetical protein